MTTRTMLGHGDSEAGAVRAHAVAKLVAVGAVGAAGMVSLNWRVQVVLFVLAVLGAWWAKVQLGRLRRFLVSLGAIALVVGGMYAFLSRVPGDVVLMRLPWGTYVSDVAIGRAGAVILRMWTLGLLTASFLATTTDRALTDGLRSVGVPFVVVFTISLSIQTFVRLGSQFASILDAYWSKGVDINAGSIVTRLRKYGIAARALMVNGLEAVRDMDYAAEARGLRFDQRRTQLGEVRWELRDSLIVSTALAVSVGCVMWVLR